MSEHDEDSRVDLAPLNLSKRKQDKDKCPFDHRLLCSDTEKLQQESELPLNLSIKDSTSSLGDHQKPEDDLDEEPCDQRQTAALALCQLASASSSVALCGFGSAQSLNDSRDTRTLSSSDGTKHKSTVMKRANRGEVDENHRHKPNKRVKVPGRVLRRRSR